MTDNHFIYAVFIYSVVGVMGSKDCGYDVILRGEIEPSRIQPGRWVFFQRAKVYGGGFWGGRTYPDYYEFGTPWPTSLSDGINYMFLIMLTEEGFMNFHDDFQLE